MSSGLFNHLKEILQGAQRVAIQAWDDSGRAVEEIRQNELDRKLDPTIPAIDIIEIAGTKLYVGPTGILQGTPVTLWQRYPNEIMIGAAAVVVAIIVLRK